MNDYISKSKLLDNVEEYLKSIDDIWSITPGKAINDIIDIISSMEVTNE